MGLFENLGLATVAVVATLASVPQANATDITGSIYFDQGFVNNGYDPSNGGVPPDYGNENSDKVVVGPGVEFGFEDSYNRDTADFQGLTLVIEDQVLSTGAGPWQQTFTADTAGYFDNATLLTSSFSPDISYSVSGDTLTIDWPGEYYSGSADFKATFAIPNGGTISAAPEPASWALMIAGVGMVGLSFRAAKRRQGFATAI